MTQKYKRNCLDIHNTLSMQFFSVMQKLSPHSDLIGISGGHLPLHCFSFSIHLSLHNQRLAYQVDWLSKHFSSQGSVTHILSSLQAMFFVLKKYLSWIFKSFGSQDVGQFVSSLWSEQSNFPSQIFFGLRHFSILLTELSP